METKSFERLLDNVAVELYKLRDEGWHYSPDTENQSGRHYGKLINGSTNLQISVNSYSDGYSSSAKQRIRFGTSWPRDHKGSYKRLSDYGIVPYNTPEPEISVSIEATPKRIASELSRRLIVDFDLFATYDKLIARHAEAKAYDERKRALAVELFGIVEKTPRERDLQQDSNPTISLYEYGPGVSHGDVIIQGDDSVQLKVSGNGDVAREFLRFLKKRKDKADAKREAETFAEEHIILVGVGDPR